MYGFLLSDPQVAAQLVYTIAITGWIRFRGTMRKEENNDVIFLFL